MTLALMFFILGYGQEKDINKLVDTIVKLELKKVWIKDNHAFFIKRDSIEKFNAKSDTIVYPQKYRDDKWEQIKRKLKKN